jgi:hypothetical protein
MSFSKSIINSNNNNISFLNVGAICPGTKCSHILPIFGNKNIVDRGISDYLFPRSGIWAIQPLRPFLIICFHLPVGRYLVKILYPDFSNDFGILFGLSAQVKHGIYL